VERRCGEFVTAVRRAVLLENHYSSAGPGGDAVEFDGARFTAYPVDQSDVLRRLWEPYRNVVFTSATLFPAPHEAGLLWFCRRHGLEGVGVAADAVASPFRYAEQMKAFVLRDPDLYPSEVFVRGSGMYVQQEQRRRAKLAEAVLAAAGAARGGVMVLFTSREEMDAVADLVAGRVPPGRLLLVQGRDGGRSSLLKRFREHGRGLLFGLDSFWQGVDVPGDALQVLVIARLPFPNPRDPLVEARVRLAGDRKWEEVYRPEACMALRQGVGRLIRSESDKGAVVVADPRATKRHRRLLEEALPVGAEVVDGVPDLVAALNEFFTE
jgi:ATP-dependent DNA helicase DinG